MISIVVPAYNAENFISNILDATFKQNYRPIEVVLVDDGSADKTRDFVKEFAKKYHLIDIALDFPGSDVESLSWFESEQQFTLIYIKQQNAGPSAARNRGIRLSRGDFIALLDVDDSWRKDKLSLQMKMLENDDCDFVFTNTVHISDDGHERLMFDPQVEVPFRLHENVLVEPWRDLIHRNFVTTSSVLASRRCFEEGRLFNENRRLVEDWELWLKIAEKFAFGYVAEPCVTKLAVESGLSNNSLGMTQNCIEVLENFIQSRFNVSVAAKVEDADARSALFKEYKWGGYSAMGQGEDKLARRYLSKALGMKFDLKTVGYYLRSLLT